MKRKFLFSFYETPQGKLLLEKEKEYLARSITVSYKQTILQIGSLGWEDEFIDCSLYQNYIILDAKGEGCAEAIKVCAKSFKLPIQSESVDLVLLPHLVEFDINRFQTMREIERILKPEGEVVIINLNPLNIWVRMQFLWDKKMSNTWNGHFILRTRLADWLKLLNFEIKTTSEFTIGSISTISGQFVFGQRTFSSMAYAVRAVKRQYTLIPLAPIKERPAILVSATPSLKLSTQRKKKI